MQNYKNTVPNYDNTIKELFSYFDIIIIFEVSIFGSLFAKHHY
jgi:hypothetical protein